MIDFSLTDEQKALQELARDFAQKEIVPVATELDRTGQFPRDLLKKAHKLGLLNLTIEDAYGGGGLGWLDACIVGEEFAAACAGFTTAANANELALTPLHLAASEEQKQKFIAPIAKDGGFAAFCVTEPSAGSDVVGMRTRALKSGNEYILNGTKHFITNGDIADLLTVFALTDPEKKHRGMSLFAVPANLPGITRRHMGEKMGHRASDTAEIVFEDVHVPAANLIGKEGDSFRVAMETFDRTRIGMGASGVGVARASLEAARQVCERASAIRSAHRQFPRIAIYAGGYGDKNRNGADDTCTMRRGKSITKCRTGTRRQSPKRTAPMLRCKWRPTRCNCLAGYGYYAEYKVEKYMRDAKLLQIYEGTNQIQRVVIARALLKD